MKTFKILRHAAVALCLIPAAVSANNATVTKTTTYEAPAWHNLYCATWTYNYTVHNPATCTTPVDRFCVTFHRGLQHIDTANIQAPAGWTWTVDHANNRICFNARFGFSQVQTGASLGGFKVPTVCNANSVEGKQDYDLAGPGGHTPLGNGQCAFDGAFLYGDLDVQLGTPALIASTADVFPDSVSVVFASISSTQGIPTILGDLYLDPIFIQEIGAMPLDPLGTGQMQLPIPPDPNLAGFQLPLQALVFDPRMPAQIPLLSNLWQVNLH